MASIFLEDSSYTNGIDDLEEQESHSLLTETVKKKLRKLTRRLLGFPQTILLLVFFSLCVLITLHKEYFVLLPITTTPQSSTETFPSQDQEPSVQPSVSPFGVHTNTIEESKMEDIPRIDMLEPTTKDQTSNDHNGVDEGVVDSDKEILSTDTHLVVNEASEYGTQSHLPYFNVHPGPGKTGTTTIQTDFKNKKMNTYLEKDNYLYIPRLIGMPIIPNNSTEHKSWRDTLPFQFVNELEQVLEEQETLSVRNNIFYSNEYLGNLKPTMCQFWRERLMEGKGRNKQKWYVHAIIGYRRIHQLYVSHWNQWAKLSRDPVTQKPRNMHLDWPPLNGDTQIIPIDEWMETFDVLNTFITSQKVYNLWKDCSDDITVFNIHNIDVIGDTVSDMSADFACKALKDANYTCSHMQQKNHIRRHLRRRTDRFNPSRNLNYDMLGVYAYQNGYMQSPKQTTEEDIPSRPYVAMEIEDFIKTNDLVLPMKCLSSELLGSIYDVSLSGEQWFYSVSGSRKNHGKEDVALTPDQLDNFHADWNETITAKKILLC